MAQDELRRPRVQLEEDLRDRVLLFGVHLPDHDGVRDWLDPARAELELLHPREEQPHGRIERHGEHRRDGHGEVLREGERLE
jgi:hypothetical protein